MIRPSIALSLALLLTASAAADETVTIQGDCRHDGEPVAGAAVDLYYQTHSGGHFEHVAHTTSTARGTFRFEAVRRREEAVYGYYLVSARREGSGLALQKVRCGPGFPPRRPTLTLQQAGHVRGTALGPDGKAVAGARVRIICFWRPEAPGAKKKKRDWVRPNGMRVVAPDFPDLHFFGPLDGMSCETDEQGSFEFRGLPRGAKVEVQVMHPDFRRTRTKVVVPATRDALILQPGASVRGRVLGVDGKPAVGVQVRVQGVRTSSWGKTQTDAQGRYLITSLEPDRFNVWAEKKGVTLKAIDSLPLQVGRTSKAPDLRFVRGGFITGRVVGRPGRPHPGLSVGLHGPSRPKSGAGVESTRVQDDWTFTIRAAPGKNYLYLMDKGTGGKWVTVVEGETTVVDLDP